MLPFVCLAAHGRKYPHGHTPLHVKLLLPPRQSRGASLLASGPPTSPDPSWLRDVGRSPRFFYPAGGRSPRVRLASTTHPDGGRSADAPRSAYGTACGAWVRVALARSPAVLPKKRGGDLPSVVCKTGSGDSRLAVLPRLPTLVFARCWSLAPFLLPCRGSQSMGSLGEHHPPLTAAAPPMRPAPPTARPAAPGAGGARPLTHCPAKETGRRLTVGGLQDRVGRLSTSGPPTSPDPSWLRDVGRSPRFFYPAGGRSPRVRLASTTHP